MSTKKKSSNSTISGLKASNASDGKLIDSIKESLKEDTVLPLFQFISDSLEVTGGNGLKLNSSKVILFECVAKDYIEAFERFKNDIKNKLNIVSDADVAYVLHDMFGEKIHIISTTERTHNFIQGYCKKI